jgi:hypothetical protein
LLAISPTRDGGGGGLGACRIGLNNRDEGKKNPLGLASRRNPGGACLRVWDLQGKQPPRILEGHTGWVSAVALSGDGRFAVSGSRDWSLRLWDLQGKQPPRVLEGHTAGVNAVTLSGDGRFAVSGSSDGSVRVWDLQGKQPPRIHGGHTDGVSAAALSFRRSAARSPLYRHRCGSDFRSPSKTTVQEDAGPCGHHARSCPAGYGRRAGAGDATGALAANDTDSMARDCDPRLDGIVVLGISHNSDIDSPGNRRRPGDRVIFRGAALIL